MKVLAVFLLAVVVSVAGQKDSGRKHPGNYIIFTPNIIRPGVPFTFNVGIRGGSGPVTVTATVKLSKNESDIIATTTQELPVGANEKLTLEIPPTLAFTEGDNSAIYFEITGSGGLDFSENGKLRYSADQFSIFIQSDKAIYKPGQTVYYRVMAVFPDLKPYLGAFDIEIQDPRNNIIQQLKNVQNSEYGVVSEKLPMSSEPILGDWTIKVSAEGHTKRYTITIEEYVLPKFEVQVSLPSFITKTDKDLAITVNAKYTYGKPVEGSCEVVVNVGYYGQITRNVEVDGLAQVLIPLRDIQAAYTSGSELYSGLTISVTATVTEYLTGLSQDNSNALNYYKKSIKVEALPITSSIFKPGLTYTSYLSVTHQDGSTLSDEERRKELLVVIKPIFEEYDGEWIQQAYSIPETGVLEAKFEIPDDVTGLRIAAYYYRPTQPELGNYMEGGYNNYLTLMVSPSSTYMQLTLNTAKPKTGSVISFTVILSERPLTMNYVVIAKGSMVLLGTVDTNHIGNIPWSADFSFMATQEMAPKAKVMVYYVRSDGEVVVDSLKLLVDGLFENQVEVSYDQETVEPGDRVSFKVSTSASSYVGILAVDQSVVLLKSGNDITQEQVIDAISVFDNDGDYYPGGPVYRRKRSSIWYPYFSQGSSAGIIIRDAGLLIFTDGSVVDEDATVLTNSNYRYDYVMFAMEADGAVAGRIPQFAAENENVAFKAGGVSRVEVRKEFPETWLWSEHISGSDGLVTVTTTIPDTITSWLGSAFSMSRSAGLGISESPTEITVLKSFFISMNLPYSVVRGETVIVQASIFNYFSKDVRATVTLQKSPQFENMEVDKSGNEVLSSRDQTLKVDIPANKGVSVNFIIRPIGLGYIDIQIQATTSLAGDAVRRQLLVEAEGVSHSTSESRLLNEPSQATIREVFHINLPITSYLVEGSVRALLSVTGDIMGPTMNNLDNLLQMPYGCGEQNMMNFAPDVFIYKYLTLTNQNNMEIKNKAINFMIAGYQRELTYRHNDGSFSAFGMRDISGSAWLTSFVLKSFIQAQPFIFIDPNVIHTALTWVIRTQRNGEFLDPGRIVDQGIQGGVTAGATLTAYITIALQEAANSPNVSDTFKLDINRAIKSAKDFLEAQYRVVKNDPYALSMVTYALVISGSSMAGTFKTSLDDLAILDGGQRHWGLESDEPDSSDSSYWWRSYHGPPSGDIEMTSYALLTYLHMDDIAGAASIARWLTHQRNPFGGYGSTQDTVIGLQALTEFASHFYDRSTNMELTVTASDKMGYEQTFQITAENAVVLQQFELPVQSGEIVISGSGQGTCLLSLALFYNFNDVQQNHAFDYTVNMRKTDAKNRLQITACGKYTGSQDATSMCLMDIGIPSGYTPDHGLLSTLVNDHQLLQKFEVVQQNLYLYFDEIPKDEETCATFTVERTNAVANVQPKVARLFDYYKPSEQVVVLYSSEDSHGTSVCDVCPDCTGCSGSARQPYVSLLLLLVTLVVAVIIGKN